MDRARFIVYEPSLKSFGQSGEKSRVDKWSVFLLCHDWKTTLCWGMMQAMCAKAHFSYQGHECLKLKEIPRIKRMGSMGDLYFHGHSDCISQNY